MNGLEKRGEALENMFFNDEKLRFKAEARRNRLIGLWVADKLGKNGEVAEAYANEIVLVDLEEPGIEDVVRKLMKDLREANVSVSEEELRTKLSQLYEEAMLFVKENG